MACIGNCTTSTSAVEAGWEHPMETSVVETMTENNHPSEGRECLIQTSRSSHPSWIRPSRRPPSKRRSQPQQKKERRYQSMARSARKRSMLQQLSTEGRSHQAIRRRGGQDLLLVHQGISEHRIGNRRAAETISPRYACTSSSKTGGSREKSVNELHMHYTNFS